MPTRQPTVTLADVAKEAGVSQPTVSRALKGHPHIAEETKRRIKEVAKKMGYRPNPAMSALIAYRQSRQVRLNYGKIAVWNFRGREQERTPVMERELAGIRQKADELGYAVEVYTTTPEAADQKRLSRILYSQGVKGILVGSFPHDTQARELKHFAWEQFCSVALTRKVPFLHYVVQNLEGRTQMAYRKLREMGYRRIGYCNRLGVENNNEHLFLGAYLKCLYLDGFSPDALPPLLYGTHRDFSPLAWIKRHKFDAILAGISQDVLEALKGTPYRVPEKLGVAGVCIPLEDPRWKYITGSGEDLGLLGSSAVELLHQLLCHGQTGIPKNRQAILLEGSWQEGETTRNVFLPMKQKRP